MLLDEFQDTDPIQLEIAVRLTAAPDGQPRHDTDRLRPLPGRLFVVGDPKQSIYRFRRADIATYLARRRPGRRRPRAALSANFRSTDAVIDWVNGVFAAAIRAEPDVQPAYGRARRVPAGTPRPRHGARARRASVHDGDDVDAEELRGREAAVGRRPPWRPRCATAGRSATATAACGRASRATSPSCSRRARRCRCSRPRSLGTRLPYRAENASVVYLAPEIRDLLLALRAAADPTDELALVAALRTPLYGCSDVELYDWRQAGGRVERLRRAARRRLAATPSPPPSPTFARSPTTIGRSTPADLLDRLVVERRVLETRARRARRPRRVAAGALRPRPGPGVDRRRRPGRAPVPALGRATRPARAGRATRSCPSATTTPCG